ncbi:MAG: hypothetical protein II559_02730 [Muribaculaceae bacterium]|nr:hypothetical protein [Muribaculaceae bacterium]MDY6412952.1 hypothetical protein [Bacteroidales bacterium]
MKRQVFTQLTTAERLTLLEQIFAPQGECSRVEFASCTLSDMAFMFDFADANLVKIKWPNEECELSEIIERTKHLLSPEVEQKFGLGMPYYVHAVLPLKSKLITDLTNWFQHNEPIALEHFVTSTDTGDITIHVAYIKNEIGDKIADKIEKTKRII